MYRPERCIKFAYNFLVSLLCLGSHNIRVVPWIYIVERRNLGRMPYDHMMYYYPFMGFWTSLIWLVGIAIVAYLIYKLIKSEKILAPSKPLIKSTQDLLEERYVKGELTREQFLQMKDDIKKPTEG